MNATSTFKPYAVAKCNDIQKLDRLADFCYHLAVALAKCEVQGTGRDWDGSLQTNDLYDMQNTESVKGAVFYYGTKTAYIDVDCSTWYVPQDRHSKINYTVRVQFPLWLLKKAAQEGVKYVAPKMLNVTLLEYDI